jgi:hypothetical protein
MIGPKSTMLCIANVSRIDLHREPIVSDVSSHVLNGMMDLILHRYEIWKKARKAKETGQAK